MPDITDNIEVLKGEIGTILTRYKVPLDDRSFIMDKIDEGVGNVLESQKKTFEEGLRQFRDEIISERENVRGEVETIKKSATSAISRMDKRVKAAYQEGVSEGLSQAKPAKAEVEEKKSEGPSLFQVVVGLSLVTLAIAVIAGAFSSKK